ncbi:hypothetical protein ABZP36_025250 [Zizania latifolia]
MAAASRSASASAQWWRWKWRMQDAVLALLVASVLASLLLYTVAPVSPFSISIYTSPRSTALFGNDTSFVVKEPVQTVASDSGALKAGSIQQVVDRGSRVDRSVESRGNKDDGAHNVEETVIAVNEKEGFELGKSGLTTKGKMGENKVGSLSNAGDLNITLNTKESDITAVTGNTGQSTTSQDSTIGVLKDQLKRAKTYIGFLSSRVNHGFVKDLKRRMRDIQQALSGATSDNQLPKNVNAKIREMELTLTKVKQVHENCAAVINKLQATLHSTEEQMQAHKQEANYVTQIAAKALPKTLHCLAMQLMNEYYSSTSNKKHFPYEEKLEDPKLQHYALFSDNILAAAVVVNSTIVYAKTPANHVFHIVTDKLNYAAMRMWFLANSQGKAAIDEVQNTEDFAWLNSSYSLVLKQLESHFMINYYFKTQQDKPDKNPKFWNPKYLSVLNHLRFYLPEIFPNLNKVLFLDDGIVVQKDLSALWSVDLKGKVNGAVQTSGETFHRFERYLNFSNPLIARNFDRHACGWAYGMNMFDLSEWRKQNITDVYHYWQELNEHRLLGKLGTLPAGLVTFWNQTFPLDRKWHLLGLGYKPNVNQKDIERATVIHYNGNLKPWLEIGVAKYHKYWSRYINFDNAFLRECNIHR